jgi:protease-4
MTDATNTTPPTEPTRPENWERGVLERLAFAALAEQRRARRWTIFFRFFYAILFVIVLLIVTGDELGGAKAVAGKHTALVELDGIIESESLASADNVIAGLRSAFESTNTVGVILRANSPGGSPVQSGYIYDEIKRLRVKYPKIPLYAVVTDVCASGCYYAAVAADKVYADKASIVGSIGVLMDGFGFAEAMKKLGIERRLMTAGEHKGFLDPFGPVKPEEAKFAQGLLNQIHQQFITRVREGRGAALKETKDMFSGLFWTGEQALKLGLVDELASAGQVARDVIQAEEIVDYTYREGLFDRFARKVGAGTAQALSSHVLGRSPSLR